MPVCKMTTSMVLPKNIWMTLKNINGRNETTIKYIYFEE